MLGSRLSWWAFDTRIFLSPGGPSFDRPPKASQFPLLLDRVLPDPSSSSINIGVTVEGRGVSKSVKLLAENLDRNYDFGFSNGFFDMTPKPQAKKKIDMLDFITIKNFL